MKNLVRSPRNALNDYTTASNYRNLKLKLSLTQLQSTIQTSYSQYLLNYNSPIFSPIPLTPSQSFALTECFKLLGPRNRLNALRQAVLSTTAAIYGKCPFCMISPATEIDHFLPKSFYPEFCIFEANLIPICHRCNRKKDTHCAFSTGKVFFHSYFDSEPQRALLKCQVRTYPTVTTRYSVVHANDRTDRLAQLFNNQFEVLNLAELYMISATEEMNNERLAFARVYSAGGWNALCSLLKEKANDNLLQYGLNHWKSQLYIALSNSSSFYNGGYVRI